MLWPLPIIIAGWTLAGVALAAAVVIPHLDRVRGQRRCPRCWYLMCGSPGMTCPECGFTATTERQFFRWRRRWRLATWCGLAAFIIACVTYFGTAPQNVARIAPTAVLTYFDDPWGWRIQLLAHRPPGWSGAAGHELKRRLSAGQLREPGWLWPWVLREKGFVRVPTLPTSVKKLPLQLRVPYQYGVGKVVLTPRLPYAQTVVRQADAEWAQAGDQMLGFDGCVIDVGDLSPGQKDVSFTCELCDGAGVALWSGDMRLPLSWDDAAQVTFHNPQALQWATSQANRAANLAIPALPPALARGPWLTYLTAPSVLQPFEKVEPAGLEVIVKEGDRLAARIILPSGAARLQNRFELNSLPVPNEPHSARYLFMQSSVHTRVEVSEDASLFRW